MNNKLERALRRKKRVRAVIHGSTDMPRISIFRSNVHFYAQAIDDLKKHTVASVSSKTMIKEKMKPTDRSAALGKLMAEQLKKGKFTKAVLDRGPYAYKGNVKAFTDALRENGITI